MKIFKGKGVSGTAAEGKIFIFKKRSAKIDCVEASDSEAEKRRFLLARDRSVEQLGRIYNDVLERLGEADAAIFEIHQMLIEDEDLNAAILGRIENDRLTAEYAVERTARDFAQMFSSMEDEYMRARAEDVKDIAERIISNLTGAAKEENVLTEKVIVCAEDLTPSETITLDKEKTLAFVTARGSVNSHTAILARSMNIPAVTAVGDEFLKEISDGDEAIIDGTSGEIFLSPDEKTRESFHKKQAEKTKQNELLQQLKGKENVTLDGTKIEIFANIGSVGGADKALQNDAGGIGLFRSEFLYLESEDYPTEEQQLEAYKSVLQKMSGKRVIIRTLDIGADKQADYFGLKKEENPALGLRAIRLCLTRPEIFKTQLRALYRASVFGELGIMFPMITSVWEVEKILEICDEVKSELKSQGINYSENVSLGIMIETPAAALVSDKLARLADFFSVGTNDLTQYTLACDRLEPELEGFVDPHHEAVLSLIRMSADNAHRYGKWIGICGELAADLSLTETFLRMGIDELSVTPAFILPLREEIRKIDLRK